MTIGELRDELEDWPEGDEIIFGCEELVRHRCANSREILLAQASVSGSFYETSARSNAFPQRLKSVLIIAFAFFLDGGVSKSAYRGAQALYCLVPNPEKFRQSTFRGFALWLDRDISSLRKH
jgi:hypothetical protein